MIRIGLMGDIGSGKSFVAKLFSCPVFDADREVNILYKNMLSMWHIAVWLKVIYTQYIGLKQCVG